MKFPTDVAKNIFLGRKTTARRPIRNTARTYRGADGSVERIPYEPKPGDVWSTTWESTDPVLGSPTIHSVRFEARAVRRESLRPLTVDEARHEGFIRDGLGSPEWFAVWWVDSFEGPWLKQFEERMERPPLEPEKLRRFEVITNNSDEHSPPDVWVIQIHPLHDEPRLLGKTGRRDANGEGYVSNLNQSISLDEPEAVPVEGEWLDTAERQRLAREKDAIDRARQARRLLDSEERIRRLKAAARLNHVDVRPEVAIIQRYLRQGRNQNAVELRFEAAEKVAYLEDVRSRPRRNV